MHKKKSFEKAATESIARLPSPLLLALSGGSDSSALFHLFLRQGFDFEVAHVNHCWREESTREAFELESLCDSNKIPFHLKELSAPQEKNNLEEKGREARLLFFREVCQRRGLKGVALAHHAADQAETVLKRIFEGAHLQNLQGLRIKKEWEGLTLFRPLLGVTKASIIEWLTENKLPYFEDPSNADPRFLRGRLRHSILPQLSEQFGKEVASNLNILGERAAELADFLDCQMAPYKKYWTYTDERWSADFSALPFPHPFLGRALLKEFFLKIRLSPSRLNLDVILEHLKRNSCHINLRIGAKTATIHRGFLAISGEK